jgi:hypothetical protein
MPVFFSCLDHQDMYAIQNFFVNASAVVQDHYQTSALSKCSTCMKGIVFYARLEAQSALVQRYNCAAFSRLRERRQPRAANAI